MPFIIFKYNETNVEIKGYKANNVKEQVDLYKLPTMENNLYLKTVTEETYNNLLAILRTDNIEFTVGNSDEELALLTLIKKVK